jgi:hypothetical protein
LTAGLNSYLSSRNGVLRAYVMMQPFVFEPILTLTVGLYRKPKVYADQDSAIGEPVGAPRTEGVREVQLGNAQAWYYPADRMLVIWEFFFDSMFHRHPFTQDRNMQDLWQSFERWLLQRFPETEVISTPFNDPIAENSEEYQDFLKKLEFSATEQGVFGKVVS